MLEVAIWWFSDLLDKSDEQRLTETKPISVLAREAGNIAHRKLTSKSDLEVMKEIAKRVEESLAEAEPCHSWRAHTNARRSCAR
jgi:hypothetical protein